MAKIPPTRNNPPNPPQPEVPSDLVFDPLNPIVLNTCSNTEDQHSPACDGNCKKYTMTKLDVEITNEMRAWARAGMATDGIQVDAFEMDMTVSAAFELMFEKGILDREEWVQKKRELTLAKLREIRANVEPQIRRQRIAAVGMPKLLGPNGEIIH